MFTFELTEKEYKKCLKLGQKKSKLQNPPGTVNFILAVAALFGVIIIRADLFIFVLPLILAGFGVFELVQNSAGITKNFAKTPYLYGKQYCIPGEDGIELRNSFESMFSKYKDVYCVKNSRRYVAVLLSLRKGMIFLDKKAHPAEAEELIAALKKGGVEL